MNIDLKENEISIDDKESFRINSSRFMFGMMTFFFSLKLYKMVDKPVNEFALFSSALFVCAALIALFLTRKSDSKKSYLYSEIDSINQKKVIGKTLFYLKLKNGKKRKLPIITLEISDQINKKLENVC